MKKNRRTDFTCYAIYICYICAVNCIYFDYLLLQIAEIIDERPDEVKQLEIFRTNKWKVLGGETLNI